MQKTYAADSRATNNSKLYDAYVKFFRWASDRLEGRDGIVCLIANNNFLNTVTFDGMRRELLRDFTRIYHVDLAGNFRKGKGEGENVFGNVTSVGVGITLALSNSKHESAEIHYHRVSDGMSAADKRSYLAECIANRRGVLDAIIWKQLQPDGQFTWLRAEHADEFATLVPLGTKEAKATKGVDAPKVETVFKTYSLGVNTKRDLVVFDFDRNALSKRIDEFAEAFNAEVDRYKRRGSPENIDDFVKYELVKWSRELKIKLRQQKYINFGPEKIRQSIYRPFTKRTLYFDRTVVDFPSLFPSIFPTLETEFKNMAIIVGVYGRKPFSVSISSHISDLNFYADPQQSFPFYTYDPDGTNRRENITDWALATFRDNYGDPSISKLDIFHYVYGLLHHPGYRERHADSLKRELPRIPLAPDFAAFREAGEQLAQLHLNYEREQPFDLDWEIADPERPIDYRVEKMRPLKRVPSPDGDYRIFDSLEYNNTLTLRGIPAEAFRYRLGTRSALEWVVDQYQVKTDKRSGIVSDPNAWSDDPHYIVNLVGRVVAVSMRTVRIVDGLAALPLLEA